jgi:hydrogenase expression/formation protein HypC
MCLVLPAKMLAVHGATADVELYGGMQATVSLAVQPEVAVGQYVMVDRGLVLSVIESEEVETILAMYDEIGQLLAEADSTPDLAAMFGGDHA